MPSYDLYLELNSDFVLTASGDLQISTGWDLIRQNFERAVFTNPATTQQNGNPIPADWIFEPNYGLGARALIGSPFNQVFINALQQKVYQAALVAQSGNAAVPPQVTVTQAVNPQEIQATVVITPIGGQQQTLTITQ